MQMTMATVLTDGMSSVMKMVGKTVRVQGAPAVKARRRPVVVGGAW